MIHNTHIHTYTHTHIHTYTIPSALTLLITLITLLVNATPSSHTTYPTEIVVNVLYPIGMIVFYI
jgi:hypothetical protein